jgi:hypothetical protein
MGFIHLFTFTLFTFVSRAFKNTFILHNQLKNSNKLFNHNILNNDNIITHDFVYIISHHYECDDYFYQSYCDLHRIYKTEKESFLKIYNNKFDKDYKDLHFKVVKYKINKINETEQFSEVLYDSYKHIINKNLQVINRKKEKHEDFAQTWRLYDWTH